MIVALLHSNGQLRTERDGDTEKGCQKPAVQQKTTDDDQRSTDLQPANSTCRYISTDDFPPNCRPVRYVLCEEFI